MLENGRNRDSDGIVIQDFTELRPFRSLLYTLILYGIIQINYQTLAAWSTISKTVLKDTF